MRSYIEFYLKTVANFTRKAFTLHALWQACQIQNTVRAGPHI